MQPSDSSGRSRTTRLLGRAGLIFAALACAATFSWYITVCTYSRESCSGRTNSWQRRLDCGRGEWRGGSGAHGGCVLVAPWGSHWQASNKTHHKRNRGHAADGILQAAWRDSLNVNVRPNQISHTRRRRQARCRHLPMRAQTPPGRARTPFSSRCGLPETAWPRSATHSWHYNHRC